MGWIKADLDDAMHGKLKHYRDRHDLDSLTDAVEKCIVKEINRDEKENGRLDSTNESEHPTWD